MADSGTDRHGREHEEQAVIVEEHKGGQKAQKRELRPRIEGPIKHEEYFP
jgi:hypothetical protein